MRRGPGRKWPREVLAKTTFVRPVAVVAAMEMYKAIQQLRDAGRPILTVGHSEASGLEFSPGHPRNKVIYVGHPARPTRYLTAAEFHGRVFEDKVSDAMRLLRGLGATEIQVQHVTGWSSAAGIKAGAAPGPIGAGAEVASKRSQARDVAFSGSLVPFGAAAVPPGLVWLDNEPLWQALVDLRLNGGLDEFSLEVRYDDDFGVDARLKGEAKQARLELGGDYTTHTATVWNIRGRFGPLVAAANET